MKAWRIVRARDAVSAESLASLPTDVRDLVERAAWRMDITAVVARAGAAEAAVTLTPNPAAVELVRRAEQARSR